MRYLRLPRPQLDVAYRQDPVVIRSDEPGNVRQPAVVVKSIRIVEAEPLESVRMAPQLVLQGGQVFQRVVGELLKGHIGKGARRR